jgi:predicted MFS family arabinose efflux permease
MRLKLIIALQGLSFMVFWKSEILVTSFIALLLVGFGTSMQFALSTLRLLRFGKDKPDLAIGKSSLGAGFAIGLSPLFLGFLADRLGIVDAFLLVPALVICAFVIVALVPSNVHESEKL